MKPRLILLLGICFGLFAFKAVTEVFFYVPQNWPKPVYDFYKNALSQNKIELGRALFYDPVLSRNNTISCASCHSQYNSFTHADHALSHGIEDKIGFRNSPALINLAWQKLFMRDGAVNHLDMQALSPISNSVEMDENMPHVVAKLQATTLYPILFQNAFGDSIITGERTLKALSQFMLTLVSCNAKYDSVLRNQATFTEQESRGYKLFKINCATCHTEPLFTNDKFMNIGLPMDTTLTDLGRYTVTHNLADSFAFKVPTLRNIEFSYPYMHDGRFKKLADAINHYTAHKNKTQSQASQLQVPITQSSSERVDIIAFLLTLTDKSFIFNPNFSYHPALLLPKPKN